MQIVAKSAEQAFNNILEMLKLNGAETAPRGMKIKELINCCVEITNPRDRIVSCPERNISMSYAFGELCWYLSGRNDLKMMSYYSQFMERGTDDGKTLNSAYGYRIFTGEHPLIPFDQWENVKRILNEDSDSRQAIIHLHTPNNKKTNDEVCTLSLQFLVREGKLNMITTMRSNDVVLGFVYDVFSFTILHEIMANELGLELGTYYHNAGSMHIYENKFELLEKHTYSPLAPMEPFYYGLKGFDKMIEIEDSLRTCKGERRFYDLLDDVLSMPCENSLLQFASKSFLLKANNKLLKGQRCDNNYVINDMRNLNENYADVLQYIGGFSRGGNKIIIEGIDGSGKSTLANKLRCNNIDYQIQHYCKPSKVFNYFDNYTLNLNTNIDTIFDRFFLSEVVYSNVFNRHCMLDGAYISIDKENTKFIFIVAKNDEQLNVVINRLKLEDEPLKDKLKELNNRYIEISNILIKDGYNVDVLEIQGGN